MSAKRLSVLEIIIWVTLILFALLALSPYVIGYKAKSDYTNLIDQLSKISQFDLQVSKYNQGFFSSQATVTLNLPQYSETVLFSEEIVHGPVYLGLIAQGKSPLVAAVINGELDMQATHLKRFKNIFSDSSPVLYQHLISFNGDVDSQVYVPAIKATLQDESESVSVESSGAIYKQFILSADNSVKGEMNIPSLNIKQERLDIVLKESVISFSANKGENQLMIGDSVVSVGVLNVDYAEEQFALRKLIVHSITSEEGELISSGAQISAREILASNQKFGPVAFNLSLNGLNANSLLQMANMKTALDNQLAQGISEEEINSLMMSQMLSIIPNLIKQAEVHINPLSINSELGRLDADMQFKLDGADINASTDPLLLINAVVFDLNMSIDEALIRKSIAWHLDNMSSDSGSFKTASMGSANHHKLMSKKIDENLKSLVDVNWLVKEEGVYSSKISMRQGELLINETSVDAMQQIMSSVSGDNGVTAQ